MSNAQTTTFGNDIKQRRERLGLTREQLARKIGCAAVTIYKIEINERRPSAQIAELLAKQLDIEAEGVAAFVQLARAKPTGPPISPTSPTQNQPKHNIPIALVSLIGRTQDVLQARLHLLDTNTRLLVLIGSPGVGKTQLACAVARALLASANGAFAEGVCFVALAALTQADQMPMAIARAMQLDPTLDMSWSALAKHLGHQHLLLILDNFEHMLAAAPQLARCLEQCPNLKVLVTSRARLRILGERDYVVPPLAAAEAMQLFAERAQAIKPEFALNDLNTATIGAICQQLDGVPLAVELAAARIRLLSPAALRAQLLARSPLGVLAEGAVDAPARHHTLRTAIDWSYALLDEAERRAFCRLAVFVGGWSLSALMHVAELDESQALSSMSALADHSLIVVQDSDEADARFTLLESLREYAAEQLAAAGDAEAAHQRHAAFFGAYARQQEDFLRSGQDSERLFNSIEREHDNVRAALAWMLVHQQAKDAAHAGHGLWRFWWARAYWREGREWMEKALAQLPANTTNALPRAKALRTAGNVMYVQSDINQAIIYLDEAVVLARVAQDAWLLGLCLANLAAMVHTNGDNTQARALMLESLVVDPAHNDERGVAYSWELLGSIAQTELKFEEALDYWQKCLAVWRRTNDAHSTMISLSNLAIPSTRLGDYVAAAAYLQEALGLARELGSRRAEANILGNMVDIDLHNEDIDAAEAHATQALHITYQAETTRDIPNPIDNLAICANLRRDLARAFTLIGFADAFRRMHSIVLSGEEQRSRTRDLGGLYAVIAQPQHAQCYERGQAMTLDQLIAFAM